MPLQAAVSPYPEGQRTRCVHKCESVNQSTKVESTALSVKFWALCVKPTCTGELEGCSTRCSAWSPEAADNGRRSGTK